ncbi:rhamnulokinase family protein [Microbacterium sp. Mu-80]|uniref:Rhamnulokinase family protein n=1 Tax=Microbacterium bandirmense TaxID=3122050 RepID=A0ABU8LAJ2_9MICO
MAEQRDRVSAVPRRAGHVAALDFGATSGRVIVGEVGADVLRMQQFARFANEPVRVAGRLHWNVLSLWQGALDGLAAAGRHAGALLSVAADTWGVDYGILRSGRMLSTPVHYRDERTAGAVERVERRMPAAEQYARAGTQILPINTIYQFAVDADEGGFEAADGALLMPDLFSYWLSGERVAERTMASTTGLMNARTGNWDDALVAASAAPSGLLPQIVAPGTRIGALRADVAEAVGLGAGVHVLAVGAHDTASAVVATPMPTDGAAYISCGTWGLVGIERAAPVLTEEARRAGFTNESGVDGRYLFMRNAMGLWMLSESIRSWTAAGIRAELPDLLRAAAELADGTSIVDVDDPRFAVPGNMPERVAEWCRERGLAVPQSPAETVRCIVESLAAAFADATRDAARLAGAALTQINIVGGGSQNELLCQRIADRSGLAVYAGPVEATALGNTLVQARAVGLVDGELDDLRALVHRAHAPRRYDPR